MKVVVDEGFWFLSDEDKGVNVTGKTMEEMLNYYKQQMGMKKEYLSLKGEDEEVLKGFDPPYEVRVELVVEGDLEEILKDIKDQQ